MKRQPDDGTSAQCCFPSIQNILTLLLKFCLILSGRKEVFIIFKMILTFVNQCSITCGSIELCTVCGPCVNV